MTDGVKLLDAYFKASGKTKQHICYKLMVSRPRLDTILDKPDTATVGQARILKEELNIRSAKDFDTIFLPKE